MLMSICLSNDYTNLHYLLLNKLTHYFPERKAVAASLVSLSHSCEPANMRIPLPLYYSLDFQKSARFKLNRHLECTHSTDSDYRNPLAHARLRVN